MALKIGIIGAASTHADAKIDLPSFFKAENYYSDGNIILYLANPKLKIASAFFCLQKKLRWRFNFVDFI